MAKQKQKLDFTHKRRFWTVCSNHKCRYGFEVDERNLTTKKCLNCGVTLIWNDNAELKSFEGLR